MWILCVCIAGFGLGGLETISLVYVSEISSHNYRNNAQVTLITVWAAAQIVMGVVFNFVEHWRYMFLFVMGTPFAICILLAFFQMDETPRYLVSKKKFQEAKYVLKKISATNRRPPFMFKLNGEIDNDNKEFMFWNDEGNITVGGASFLEGSHISCKSLNMSKYNDLSNETLGLFKNKMQRGKTIIIF